MIEEYLQKASELYDEYVEKLEALNEKKSKAVLNRIHNAQNRYDEYIREVAKNSEMVKAIPDVAKTELGEYLYVQYAAWHIVLVSQDLDVLDKMFQIHSQPGFDWDFERIFHLLEDHEADVIINHLKNKKEEEHLDFYLVDEYIANNYRDKHLDLFLRNGVEFSEGNFRDTLCRFNVPEVINIFDKLPESTALIYIRAMLLLQIPKAWEYCRSKDVILDDNGYKISTYGGYQDLLALIDHIDSMKINDKVDLLRSVAKFGDIRALSWLFKQLEHKNQEYRAVVFTTMCDLFYREINSASFLEFSDMDEMQEMLHSREYELADTEFPEFSTENLQKLWSDVMPYIKTIREEGKYYSSDDGKEFDMLKELRRLRYADRYEIGDFILDKLTIWTGEYLPFDPHAYFKKQEAQFEAWEQFLLDNREKFAPGYRYRWGERVS